MNREPLETFEEAGWTVEVHPDEDPTSPAEWDTLTTLVHWHRGYDFGHENIRGHAAMNRGGPRMFARYIALFEGAVGILPVGMLDHSGVTLFEGSFEHYADPGGWDSGQVGFIFTTRARISELCGEDPQYHSEEWILSAVREELKTWAQYFSGDVYGYVVKDPYGEVQESCWGFYGFEDACTEAKGELSSAIVHAAQLSALKAQGWATAHGFPVAV